MDIAQLTQLISNVGFPIAVSCYTLIRLEKTMKTNTDMIAKLTTVIAKATGEQPERTTGEQQSFKL